jgi:hypothetical protein
MLIELIKKDIVFARTGFLFALAAAVLLSAYCLCGFETVSALYMNMTLSLGVIGVPISRICYTEDSAETKTFLKSLPIKGHVVVLSRYVVLFWDCPLWQSFALWPSRVSRRPVSVSAKLC